MNKKLYKLMDWPEIEGIIYSEEDNPHKLLGAHVVDKNILIQTFQPGASKVMIQSIADNSTIMMEMMDESGYFAALIPGKQIFSYRYLVTDQDGTKREIYDAYNFEPQITKNDTDRFKAGIHYTIYRCLGAHPKTIRGVKGVDFAVWAPNVIRASVVGDFNHWDGRVHQMQRLWDSGIFEIFIPDAKIGEHYKFELKVKGGLTYLKSDPYEFRGQLRPENASVITELTEFTWEDSTWLEHRKEKQSKDSPLNIYELYLGSFAKPDDGRLYYTYRELAPKVIEYIKKMGYTHIELMPIMEHPLDASWGYQVIGYYAPTARYGTPQDFMFFVNACHQAGIGVILDWVPAHFPRDAYGLSNFDGTCLYEHADPRKGSNPHWGTLIYNYGRPEVTNYLIANALFWVEQYHVDGIRMDAVASMLYLDYGKQDGEWVANIYGGNENLEAIEFLKHLNSVLKRRGNGAISIAEESTAWPKITGDLEDDGLGFDYKWNMGWMNDYLGYIQFDPYFRSHHHSELTFSMIYAYSENFVLVFSHDEVVYGKSSMIGKMPGDITEKFMNLRLTYAYQMMHPGKKLLFMGQDIGEFDEWNENRSVEWELLQYEKHHQLQHYVQALNQFYLMHPSLYSMDHKSEGFEWINSISANECVVVFLRKSAEETLLVVCNFANLSYTDYRIGIPAGKYKEIWNSDAEEFGGTNHCNKRIKKSVPFECDARKDSIKIVIPPLGVSVFRFEPFNEAEMKPAIEKKPVIEKKKRKG
ncbi:MAG: 1,4-alpha-glucan branching protein GlgB [Lachnospiraceae bacterium]